MICDDIWFIIIFSELILKILIMMIMITIAFMIDDNMSAESYIETTLRKFVGLICQSIMDPWDILVAGARPRPGFSGSDLVLAHPFRHGQHMWCCFMWCPGETILGTDFWESFQLKWKMCSMNARSMNSVYVANWQGEMDHLRVGVC